MDTKNFVENEIRFRNNTVTNINNNRFSEKYINLIHNHSSRTSLYGDYLQKQHFTLPTSFLRDYENGLVPDALHMLLKPMLRVSKCFGLLPVVGATTSDIKSIRFEWKSLLVAYAFASFICSGIILVLSILWAVTNGLTFLGTVEFVYYGSATIITIMFLNLATKWPSIVQEWESAESYIINTFGSIRKLPDRIKLLVLVVSTLVIIEYILSILTIMTQALQCVDNTYGVELFEVINQIQFKQVFSLTSFTAWKAVPPIMVNFIAMCVRNFMDLFLMVMSIILSSRFNQVNLRLESIKGKNVPNWVWRQMRESYNRLSCLTKLIDTNLSPIILFSFANNLYFICVQLLASLKPFCGFMQTIYFIYAFGFLVMKTCAVSLFASEIYDESKRPMSVLFSVPSESYCNEVDRFLTQVTSDNLALSGCRFFLVTRTLMLTVAGTVATYEIVLAQFNAVNTSDEVIQNLTAICPNM